jgi:hypothetical protein
LGFRRVGATWQPLAGLPRTDLRAVVITPAGILLAGAGGTLGLVPATVPSSGVN